MARTQYEYSIGQVVLLADTTWYPTEPLPLGIAQHHDCVTGTAKQYVANDYAKRLALAASEVTNVLFKTFLESVVNYALAHLLSKARTKPDISLTHVQRSLKLIFFQENSITKKHAEGYHQSSFVGSYASNYVTGASP
ncbi:unnamed protein product [Brassica oleracea]